MNPAAIDNRRTRTDKWYQRLTEIVDTAASLFAERGYAATGVAELGETVGLGRGALYYYIESKEHLLSLIHDRVMEKVLASTEHVRELNVDPDERLRILGEELIGIITTFPDHVWVFLHEYRDLTGERANEFRRKRREYESTVSEIIEEGADTGLFSVPDLRLTVLAWLAMHNYTYIWYKPGGRVSADDIAATYHRLFTHGLYSESLAGPQA